MKKRAYFSLTRGENSLFNCVKDYMFKFIVFFNDSKHRYYYVFNDYIEYAEYIININEKYRCFHEVITNNLQKMRFDIDIDNKDININDIIDEIISASITYLKKYGIILNLSSDVIITESCSENKISYHIIIDNYCVRDSENAKIFYNFVVSRIKTKYKKYIDNAVYKNIQNFRILGNQKFGTNRIKKFVESWKYKNNTINYCYKFNTDDEFRKLLLQLNATLITETSGCKVIPYKINRKNNESKLSDCNIENINKTLDIITNNKIFNNLKVLNVIENIITLRRIAPSYCDICKRVHEHENPYIKITDEACELYCRRNNKPLILKKFEVTKNNTLKEMDEEEIKKKLYKNLLQN